MSIILIGCGICAIGFVLFGIAITAFVIFLFLRKKNQQKIDERREEKTKKYDDEVEQPDLDDLDDEEPEVDI